MERVRLTMKVLNEDSEEELLFDVEIKATCKEIEKAIDMLQDLLNTDAMPSEAIFIKTGPLQIVRVSKLD